MGAEGSVGILRHLPYPADVQRQSLGFCWPASFVVPGGRWPLATGDRTLRRVFRRSEVGWCGVHQLHVMSRIHGRGAVFRAVRGGGFHAAVGTLHNTFEEAWTTALHVVSWLVPGGLGTGGCNGRICHGRSWGWQWCPSLSAGACRI